MAIFATNHKLDIIDDTNTGLDKETPKKPKIWGYFFWFFTRKINYKRKPRL